MQECCITTKEVAIESQKETLGEKFEELCFWRKRRFRSGPPLMLAELRCLRHDIVAAQARKGMSLSCTRFHISRDGIHKIPLQLGLISQYPGLGCTAGPWTVDRAWQYGSANAICNSSESCNFGGEEAFLYRTNGVVTFRADGRLRFGQIADY